MRENPFLKRIYLLDKETALKLGLIEENSSFKIDEVKKKGDEN